MGMTFGVSSSALACGFLGHFRSCGHGSSEGLRPDNQADTVPHAHHLFRSPGQRLSHRRGRLTLRDIREINACFVT